MKHILAGVFAVALSATSFAQINNNDQSSVNPNTGYYNNIPKSDGLNGSWKAEGNNNNKESARLNSNPNENLSGEEIYYPEGYDPAQQHETELVVPSNGKVKVEGQKSCSTHSNGKGKKKKHSAFNQWNRENGARISQFGDTHRDYKDQSNLYRLESGANYTIGSNAYINKFSNPESNSDDGRVNHNLGRDNYKNSF